MRSPKSKPEATKRGKRQSPRGRANGERAAKAPRATSAGAAHAAPGERSRATGERQRAASDTASRGASGERSHARLHRTAPARTAPIRDASMMFRPAAGGYQAEGFDSSKRAPESAAGSVKGAVEHGVDMAYRVIDELMQRGRRAAGRAGNPSNKADPVRNNQNNNLANMMMQTWMDMGRMWFGMMGPMMGGFMPPMGNMGPMGPWGQRERAEQHTHGSADSDGRVRVAVDLRSEQPAEVKIDINRLAAWMKKLTVVPLRDRNHDSHPAIAGVDVTHHQDGTIVLHVHIPAGQPHGSYHGSILLPDESAVGTVTVKIHQVHGAARKEDGGTAA